MRAVFDTENLEKACMCMPEQGRERARGVWARNIWIDNTCAYIGIGIKPEDSEGGFELIRVEDAEEFAQELLRRVEKVKEERAKRKQT